MRLVTYKYNKDIMLEHYMMEALNIGHYTRAYDYVVGLIESIYTGEVRPKIVSDEEVQRWMERSQYELDDKWGKK